MEFNIHLATILSVVLPLRDRGPAIVDLVPAGQVQVRRFTIQSRCVQIFLGFGVSPLSGFHKNILRPPQRLRVSGYIRIVLNYGSSK